MKHDNALPEVVAELTLAETGEMLARDLVEIVSQPLTNKTDLVISGLLPGQIYISLRVECQGLSGVSAMEGRYLLLKLEKFTN